MQDALHEVLLPALRARGFEMLALDGLDARSPEIRAAFPFGRLRRRREAGFEQIEVQFDKRSPNAFRLNFGFVPEAGVPHPVAHVDAEDAWVHYLDRYFTLYDCAWTRRWFDVRGATANSLSSEDFRSVAARVVELLPAVEAALSDPASARWSRHVRRVRA